MKITVPFSGSGDFCSNCDKIESVAASILRSEQSLDFILRAKGLLRIDAIFYATCTLLLLVLAILTKSNWAVLWAGVAIFCVSQFVGTAQSYRILRLAVGMDATTRTVTVTRRRRGKARG